MKKQRLKKEVATKKKEHLDFLSIREPESIYTNLYFQKDSIWIYNADILKISCIREGSIDLVVTSPPYNVDIKYNSYDDRMPYNDYLSFTKEWITKCYRLVKDDGRFCLNIPLDKNKGGQQSVCADITTIAKQIGWKYHSTIIWNEQNISKRTAWGSWLSASAPYVIAPVEVIVVLYKNCWKKVSGSRQSDITNLVACVQNNRRGIGVDIDRNYCQLSKTRIMNQLQQNRQLEFKVG